MYGPRALLLSAGDVPWRAALGGCDAVHPAAANDELASRAEQADAAFVDGSPREALAVARRLRTLDPTLQAVIVAEAGKRTEMERALLFAPGLGELWVVEPEQVDDDLLRRAASITAQRRRFRGTEKAVARDLARVQPRRGERALVSDAFLAALLDVLPDPVVSLDDDGNVLSWNPAAEATIGHARADALGRPLVDLLRPEPREDFEALLEAARMGSARGEVTYRRRAGEPAVGEVAVVPVTASGHSVRALVLHDVTHLRETQAELETQAAELQSQAAELEMLNVDLAERSADLERALATRSRFYAAMSHELRTPINAVIGYTELILEGIFGPVDERQRDALQRSARAARHLLELVNDVLDLSKIEADRIEVQVEEVVPGDLLVELMDTVRPMAEENGVALETAIGGGSPCLPVVTDPRRVRQIVLNLLSNAIKFGDGKPVTVSCRGLGDGGVEIDVADQGRGIDPADQARIFEEFVQIDRESGTGTGLGLPISRRLAQLLGGSIRVASAPGQGSTFTVRLPAKAPAAASRPLEGGAP
ncbi:PAS domain-containing sensor histidine kinase [Longimicrobium sp.]|jgi:PAS domain S-box-containing protein|uniref:PAS domain-containing sensor histidine kinase n=1 Tax=Longimicrobium sp. TaxID=2029185 RepID=UPI002F95B64A